TGGAEFAGGGGGVATTVGGAGMGAGTVVAGAGGVATAGGADPSRRLTIVCTCARPIALMSAALYFFLKWSATGWNFTPRSKSLPGGCPAFTSRASSITWHVVHRSAHPWRLPTSFVMPSATDGSYAPLV